MAETYREQPRRAGKTDDARTRLIRAVRAACRAKGIDDENRKAVQVRVIGKASMGDMTPAELAQLLDHLNKGQRAPMGHRAHIGKIRALWWTLYWLGEIDDPDESAIGAFVERQTGITALRFIDHRGAASVIEALKSWAARIGVNWPKPGEHAGPIAEAMADRRAVLSAIGLSLNHLGTISVFYADYVEAAMRVGLPLEKWAAHELDAAIRLMGRKLRRAKGKS